MIIYSCSRGKSNEKTWTRETVEADFRKSSDKIIGLEWGMG